MQMAANVCKNAIWRFLFSKIEIFFRAEEIIYSKLAKIFLIN
jgi:hypothetical protein